MIFKQKLLGIACFLAIVVALGLLLFLKEPEETASRTDRAAPVQEIERKASTNKASFEPEKQPLDKIDIEREESIEDLERRASGHRDPGERMEAVMELAQRVDGKRSIGTLVAILHTDMDEDVREAALDALDELQGLSVEILAKVALNDPDPPLRMRAVEVLGQWNKKDTRITDLLKRIANMDKDEEVKESAKEFLE